MQTWTSCFSDSQRPTQPRVAAYAFSLLLTLSTISVGNSRATESGHLIPTLPLTCSPHGVSTACKSDSPVPTKLGSCFTRIAGKRIPRLSCLLQECFGTIPSRASSLLAFRWLCLLASLSFVLDNPLNHQAHGARNLRDDPSSIFREVGQRGSELPFNKQLR